MKRIVQLRTATASDPIARPTTSASPSAKSTGVRESASPIAKSTRVRESASPSAKSASGANSAASASKSVKEAGAEAVAETTEADSLPEVLQGLEGDLPLSSTLPLDRGSLPEDFVQLMQISATVQKLTVAAEGQLKDEFSVQLFLKQIRDEAVRQSKVTKSY